MMRVISKLIHNACPGVCMDVAAWASKSGHQVKLLHPPVIDEVRPHISDDCVAQEEFVRHRTALERAQTLVTIERATIRDVVGLVELPDGQICYEGNWWLPYLQNHPAYKRRFTPKRRRLSGNVYSLLCLWAPEFYHWFHDVLPRLETALPHLPADTRFLINSSPKAWQLDSLMAFGIGADRLEMQPQRTHTRVDALWFATPLGHTSFGSGTVVRRVANRLRDHFIGVVSRRQSHHRVYISRHKAGTRRVANESKITPVIEEHGFETVSCEDLSLAEQVNLFSATVAMIGAHGAGLTNLIFCMSGSSVGEIYAGPVFPHYLVTSRQLGLHFSRFQADKESGDKSAADMRINGALFSKWLTTWFDQHD